MDKRYRDCYATTYTVTEWVAPPVVEAVVAAKTEPVREPRTWGSYGRDWRNVD